MNSLISVITCVFNGEKTIEDTILSIINQDYEKLELLIIDGNSNDGTLKIAKKYSKIDSRIRIISELDKGIYDAYNKGLTNSLGEIILFVNADDFLFPKALSSISKNFDLVNYQIYAASIAMVNEEDEYYKEHFRSAIAKHSITNPTILTPGICFSKNVFLETGTFDISYKICADFDFINRCLNKGVKIQYSDLLINHMREGGISSNNKFEFLKKTEQFRACKNNSEKLNIKFGLQLFVKFIKTILLGSIFKNKLKAKKKEIQDSYILKNIFWFKTQSKN